MQSASAYLRVAGVPSVSSQVRIQSKLDGVEKWTRRRLCCDVDSSKQTEIGTSYISCIQLNILLTSEKILDLEIKRVHNLGYLSQFICAVNRVCSLPTLKRSLHHAALIRLHRRASLASQTERWINHIYVRLQVKGRPEQTLSLAEAFEYLEEQDVAGTTDATLFEDRWIIQLAALDRDTHPGFISVLFLGIYKNRAEAVYGDINTLNLRKAPKSDTEGGAISAHLLIDLTGDSTAQGCRAVLEDVEGLSRSRIIPFLRWLFEKFVTFVEEGDNGDQLKTNIIGDIVLDRSIAEQLEDAQLVAVDVFKKARNSTIDRTLEYYEKTRLIEYKPVSPVKGSKASDLIREILERTPRDKYPETRIRIKEPAGNERTVAVDREKTDVLTAAFQLRTLLRDLNPPVDEATQTITKHLIVEMKKALIAPSKAKKGGG